MLKLNCASGKRICLLALVIISAMLFSSALLLGQATIGTGGVRGTVSDQSNAAVAGAKVILTNKAMGSVIRATTSAEGTYTSGPLQPGDYTVRVEAKGFKTVEFAERVQITLVSDGSVILEPGKESEIVRPVPTMINTGSATVENVLTANQVDLFPIGGRNYLDLAQLAPGVQIQDGGVVDASKDGLSSVSFGSRFGRAARIEVDGVDVSDETVGTTTQNVPASAIREFDLAQSSLDLATELTSSGAVSMSTLSGGNALHGEGFGVFRGNQGSAALPGSPDSRFQREQFGGRLGGALIKDKLFWFLDVERSKQDVTAPVPFVFPFNVVQASLAEPFREWLADGRLDWQRTEDAHAFYRFSFDEVSQIRPFGSFNSLQDIKNATHAPSHTFGYDFHTGPYMHSIRAEYLRMGDGVADETGAIAAGPDNLIPGLGINIGAATEGNCAMSSGGAFCGGPSQFAPQVTLQSDAQVRYDGSRLFGRHLIRFGATFNHLKAGRMADLFAFPQVGTTTACLFPELSCPSSSDPTAYSAEFVSLGNGIGFSTDKSAFNLPAGGLGPDNRIEAYVGDGWKTSPKLALTFGLHYVHDTGRVDSNLGPVAALNDWAPGLGNRVRTPGDNFAPQFGFAWDLSGTGMTIVRGGAGLFFDNSLWNNSLLDNPARSPQGNFGYTPQVCINGVGQAFNWPTSIAAGPVAGGAGIANGTGSVTPTFCGETISTAGPEILALSSAFQGAAASNAGQQANGNFVGTTLAAPNLSGFDVFAPNYRTPRSWQMNLGFQHEFHPGAVLAVDYVRNIGEHYLIAVDQNHSGAARSYNAGFATAARDRAQTSAVNYGGSHNCPAGPGQASCMLDAFGGPTAGIAGAQSAYSSAGFDSNNAVTGGLPCSYCAFPGVTPKGMNNTGSGGNGLLGTLDMLEPIGRSVYSGLLVSLTQQVKHPLPLVQTADFRLAYSYSKFISQMQDQDAVDVAVNNDNPLQFTGWSALDRTHQVSFGSTLNLPKSARLSLIGHFYSPVPQNLSLPQMTSGGEIFATDWMGSGIGSGQGGVPVPGTKAGEFQRSININNLVNVISNYNTHYAGTLTPAGQSVVSSDVMTNADMAALNWVMPSLGGVAPRATGGLWLKSFDLKASWPLKIKDRVTIEPSASVFNVLNIANYFMPGNLAGGTFGVLGPGGPNNTLGGSFVGGVTSGTNLLPYRASFQSGTYALGAPRQIEFGLRIAF